MSSITVQVLINSDLNQVWQFWTEPEHIEHWNHASDDWHCPKATNDLRVGGSFSALMSAKDASTGFEFAGTYTEVLPQQRIAYTMSDGRSVSIDFSVQANGVLVSETFDPESENSLELQRSGWQAILNNFKAYVEAK